MDVRMLEQFNDNHLKGFNLTLHTFPEPLP